VRAQQERLETRGRRLAPEERPLEADHVAHVEREPERGDRGEHAGAETVEQDDAGEEDRPVANEFREPPRDEGRQEQRGEERLDAEAVGTQDGEHEHAARVEEERAGRERAGAAVAGHAAREAPVRVARLLTGRSCRAGRVEATADDGLEGPTGAG
jgi:hypothetical protein